MITQTYEPLRPLYASDDGAPYYVSAPRHCVEHPRVDYGSSLWPSRSYWLVPGAESLTGMLYRELTS
jgi:hypothetical protein